MENYSVDDLAEGYGAGNKDDNEQGPPESSQAVEGGAAEPETTK